MTEQKHFLKPGLKFPGGAGGHLPFAALRAAKGAI